jgi:tetratricopeptide (TPR) repeat protein
MVRFFPAKLYKYYKLPDVNPGYPSKQERKDIAKTVRDKSEKLYITFVNGIEAIKIKDFEKAISSFDEVNQYFPSRENYNNSGVAKTLQALQYITIGRFETLYPNRFVYPIAYDSISRLTNLNGTRGSEEEQAIIMEKLLKSAKADFEKAIQLDPDYSTSFINLACVYDLLGNPEAAIGKIKELPLAEQEKINSLRILVIAYYHLYMESKADEIWRDLEKKI